LYEINKGELLFLRSWCFYRLWDFFRKAPLQDKRIRTISEAVLPPSEGFQMLDKAIEDLELSATLLPEENYWTLETERGRAFNESAYGLLVKCYTLRARYNNASSEDYQKAITAFEKLKHVNWYILPITSTITMRTIKNLCSNIRQAIATEQDNAWLDNNFGGGVGQMGSFYHYSTSHWSNYMSGIYGPSKKCKCF